ncbi:hypothetical protein [Sphingobium mellinum]|uniref:hypothetical protein n=1 Tax=Sphingobium mellinum TaxID=1387166 RepID=UPI0030EF74CB
MVEVTDFEDGEYLGVVDPRDEMLGDFDGADPEPIGVARMIGSDFCWMDPGLEQLLISEMISYGWLIENADRSIGLTDSGRSFVKARLERQPAWSDYFIRPDAPPLPPMSARLEIAYRASVQRYPDNRSWQRVKEEILDA